MCWVIRLNAHKYMVSICFTCSNYSMLNPLVLENHAEMYCGMQVVIFLLD